MIPLGDDIPTKTKPYVTYIIIAINILVYLVDNIGAKNQLGNLWNFSMVPQAVWHNNPVYVPIGQAANGQTVVAAFQGLSPQWLTIFTSMFMHGSLLHIGGNLLYLWIFGNNIEDTLGHFAFVVFYLAAGFLAALTHILTNVNSPTPLVGASGAIAGVLGAYWYLFPKAKIKTLVMLVIFWTFVEVPAVLVLGIWFLTQLFNVMGSSGTMGGVAYWAHAGGFVAGIVLILVMGGKKLLRSNKRPVIEAFNDWESWNKR